MKRFFRVLADGQTTVITVPSLDFNSLSVRRMKSLRIFFTKAVRRVVGRTVILDVTGVKSAGAAFLTEVFYLAQALKQNQVEMVIAGELSGLFRLAGWNLRFKIFSRLYAAIMRDETETTVEEDPPRGRRSQLFRQLVWSLAGLKFL
jgi:anti-anti-sigma regulatory factor